MALVAVGYGVALTVPSLRQAFDDGRLEDAGAAGLLWIALVRIPVGTVLLEEVAFRGVLPGLFGADARWRWGPVLAASSLFGAWHILPSMALHQNAAVDAALGSASAAVIPALAVVASSAAGVVLCWFRHAGRGLLAPALVHVATNSGGVLVAWLALGKGRPGVRPHPRKLRTCAAGAVRAGCLPIPGPLPLCHEAFTADY